MQIYKLFSQNRSVKRKKIHQLNTEVIFGESEEVFGLKVEPERYREFINNVYTLLPKSKIRQHIMTDYKFLELINQSTTLNFEVVDITFFNERSNSSDELIQDIKKNLWHSNVALLLEQVEEAIEEGYKISSITGHIKNSAGGIEQVKVYSNGTLAIENTSDYGKKYPIIDYLVKGPAILL